jgi:SnoaL-like domain
VTTAPHTRAGFTPEVFARFWADPDPELVPAALTEDVVGYWPGRQEPVRGRADYSKCIADLLVLVPDFRAEVLEHARTGDLVFIRWCARRTGSNGSFELTGIDRVRVRDGLVAENVIVFDTEEFRERVGHDVPWRDRSRR